MKRRILFLGMISSLLTLLSCTGENKNASLIDTVGYRGIIIADEINAVRAGSRILKSNGNAIDAAVSMILTMVQTLPSRASMFGAGMCKIYTNGDNAAQVYDFRTKNTMARALYMMQSEYGEISYNAAITLPELLAVNGFYPDTILLNDSKDTKKTPKTYLNLSEKTKIKNEQLAELYAKLRLNPIKGFYNTEMYDAIHANNEFYTAKPSVYPANKQQIVNEAGAGTTEFIVSDANGKNIICSLTNGSIFGSSETAVGMTVPDDLNEYLPGIRIEIKKQRMNKIVTSSGNTLSCNEDKECNTLIHDNAYTYRVVR